MVVVVVVGENMGTMVEKERGAESAARLDEVARSGGLAAPLRVVEDHDGRFGLRVAGEVDLNSYGVWEQALRRVLDASEDVHLDLAGLTFVDARSAAALVRVAGVLADGQRLVLHHPPLSLRRVLRTLWPAGVPAILIHEDAT